MLIKEDKNKIIKKFAKSEKDTGSTEVQIALLSKRIAQISDHLKVYPKDNHSKLGLIKLVGKRKTFFDYLKKHDLNNYEKLIKKLEAEKTATN
jgi:small subunit ribosomal protein S15